MTERGTARVDARYASLAIGSSEMRWTGDAIEVTIDERCAPLPYRVQGIVRLYPLNLCETAFDLDRQGLHRWQPYAPCARIDVRLNSPRLRWQGAGYFDSNAGAAPLEDSFSRWHWSRSIDSNRSVLLYDVDTVEHESRSLALAMTAAGRIEHLEPPPLARLPPTGWRVSRVTRADAQPRPTVIDTLEDAPFYARSLVRSTVHGTSGPAMHESLDLDRFRRGWVQCLLPFRMPRIR